MCVAEKRECETERGLRFCMSAPGILHCRAQHAKASITQVGNNPSHDGVTSFWNRPSGLRGQRGGPWVFRALKCLYPPFIATDTQKSTECFRDRFFECASLPPLHLITSGGFPVESLALQPLFHFSVSVCT